MLTVYVIFGEFNHLFLFTQLLPKITLKTKIQPGSDSIKISRGTGNQTHVLDVNLLH